MIIVQSAVYGYPVEIEININSRHIDEIVTTINILKINIIVAVFVVVIFVSIE